MFDMTGEEDEELAPGAATAIFDNVVRDGRELAEDDLGEELVYTEPEDPGTIVPIGEARHRPAFVETVEK
ncbi:hypothetical protein JG688_00012383 [Phytophthora aleatoria]|uniref:Uncharacterized protein n=1 Tax=Phytophthora aleatoria TaxID=2496075 RepID=A0A8J5M224_9STRA|nr:hypothetical protein JG688_00012383 [Phytophthora aleatoria]